MYQYQIPILDSIMNNSVSLQGIKSLTLEQYKNFYENCILMFCGFLKPKDFQKNLYYFEKEEVNKIRRTLLTKPKIILGLRGFIFNIFQNNIDTEEDLLVSYRNFLEKPFKININERNKNIQASNFYKNIFTEEQIKKIKSFPNSLTPIEMEKLCYRSLKEVDKTVLSYAYKNFRFICTSNALEMKDLVNQLYSEMIPLLYNALAYERGDKIKVFIKNMVKQQGINIIYFYTAKKRSRLEQVEDSDGNFVAYKSIVNSTNIAKNEEESDLLNFYSDESISDIINQIDFNTSLFSSIERINTDLKEKAMEYRLGLATKADIKDIPLKTELCKVLSNKNSEFVSWYNKTLQKSMEKVSDIAEEEGNLIIPLISQYLGINQTKCTRLLKTFKSELRNLF